MSYTSLFSLPLPFSVPIGSDPFTDCWTLGEEHKSWSVYPCRGTLLAIVTSNLKSLMTIQLEFLLLLGVNITRIPIQSQVRQNRMLWSLESDAEV